MPHLFPQVTFSSSAVSQEGEGSGMACSMFYPMQVIPVKEFLKLPRLLPHHEMQQLGVLKKWSPKKQGKVILISHQWLKFDEPDPDNEHFQALHRLLARLIQNEVPKVDDWWLHKAVFKSKATTITAQDWPEVNLWIDYSCMPQVGPGSAPDQVIHAAKAVQSIPAYAERCDLMLVVAPVAMHKDTGDICNYSTWRSRGWCRMELMCSVLSRRNVRTMICIGGDATPFLLHPCEACRLTAGSGNFSCCALGHQFHGAPLKCDKEKVRSVLDFMLTSKVQHARLSGSTVDQLYFTALRHSFLKGLPPCPEEPGCIVPSSTWLQGVLEEEKRAVQDAQGTVEKLRTQLHWQEGQAAAQASGLSLVFCAALMDDAEAVRQLTVQGGGRVAEVNVQLKQTFPHLSYMVQGATPLIVAMVYSSWPTCEALLEAGADPKRTYANGMDALFMACCKGNLLNVQAWLKRFPDWSFDRTEPGMGLSATCLSALVGSCEVQPILRSLITAKAAIASPRFFGGDGSILCLLAQNENSNGAAAKLLIDEGCDVNACWRAQNCMWNTVLRGARLASKVSRSTAVSEFAMLQGATPLHFAARRGDVPLVRLLVDARAEPRKNQQGRTPLDVANAFFGGSVPPALQAALAEAEPPRASTGLPKLLGTAPAAMEAK